MSQVLVPPQDFHANIQYRQDLRKWAVQSPKNRDWLMGKCREDFFFWCESFCWLYEPRPVQGKPKVIPFIPWDHQREPIATIINNLGRTDIGIEKARGEGASWMCLTIIQWRWLFHVMESFGLVSMNETAADSQDDPNSLGWKVDWQLKMLPAWMSGKRTTAGKPGDYIRNITKHTWMNLRTDSTIAAYACTGDLASGGRKTAFMMDELAKFPRGPDQEALAATEPITNCRLLISTPKGSDGAYFRCMTIPSSMIKIVLDWTKNPTRNQNLFLIEAGTNNLVDLYTKKETEFLQEYYKEFYGQHSHILKLHGFDLDDHSKIWSPWYVSRCIRPQMNVKMIAQEYDRDYGGSVARFFPHQLITMLLERTQQPLLQGDLICNTSTMKVKSFTKLKYGHLKLWVNLSTSGAPPKGEYVLGIDVATGQGGAHASNSVISIVDRKRAFGRNRPRSRGGILAKAPSESYWADTGTRLPRAFLIIPQNSRFVNVNAILNPPAGASCLNLHLMILMTRQTLVTTTGTELSLTRLLAMLWKN